MTPSTNAALLLLLAAPRAVFAADTVPGAPVGLPPPATTPTLTLPQVQLEATPAQLRERYQAAKQARDQTTDAVVAIPAAARTFLNTIVALETVQGDYSHATLPIHILSSVSPDAAIRREADALRQEMAQYSVAYESRQDLYNAVREYAAKQERLSAENQRLLNKWLSGFRRDGMYLSQDKRAEIQRLQTRLAELRNAFANNIRDSSGGMDFTREHLQRLGLPEDYIGRLRASPVDAAKLRVSLDPPEYRPFLRYANDAELRRRMQLEYFDRVGDRNVPVLEEMLDLRTRLARLLGYESYAAYVAEPRMAANTENIWRFLNQLKDGLVDRVRTELGELLELKRRDEPGAERINLWDQTYYEEKLRKERYDVNEREIQQYFPVHVVVNGTLGVYQDILGLVFSEIPNYRAWHPDVKLYQINDKATGSVVGHFFMDLHPRPGKRSEGAFAATIVSGRETPDGSYQAPVSALVCNFTKPTESAPALLTHREVQTFFHEFGHIMHQTLTQSRYVSFSGSRVALDFVEAPSQMLENFVWRPEVLERISGHWQDNSRKLPKELLDKMLAARGFAKASETLHQVGLAMMDLTYNTMTSPVDTTSVMRRVWEGLGLPPMPEGGRFQSRFGHLGSHYAAGYYSYLWSKVYAEDIFSRFHAEGPLNPKTGRDYRRMILERGSTQDEIDLLREFLGREPNMDAFLRSIGIQPGPRPNVN
ncbi:MAG: Zn-dependent oligopeptidase [Proteobacteria bacterium]|nr:Zn-dependent oligopeptidase [Pseudomonadota bacterium]